jgi:hypothetical protein
VGAVAKLSFGGDKSLGKGGSKECSLYHRLPESFDEKGRSVGDGS